MAEQNWRLAKARAALNEVFIDPESGAADIIGSFVVLMQDCEMYVEQCERRAGGEAGGEGDEAEEEGEDG
jgi:hypothetical protein